MRLIAHACTSILAALTSATLLYFCFLNLPQALSTHTDIVGYPLHRNFNINRLYWGYALLLAFPFMSFFFYGRFFSLFFQRYLINTKAERPASLVLEISSPTQSALLGSLATGFLLGLLWIGKPSLYHYNLWYFLIGSTFAYSLSVWGLSYLAQTYSAYDRGTCVRWINSFFLPILSGLPYFISNATLVVEQGGRVRYFPWVSLPLSLSLFLTILVWVVWKFKNPAKAEIAPKVQQALLLYLGIPIFLFSIKSVMAGSYGQLEYFNTGEPAATAYWISKGFFPYRDIHLMHGPLFDIFTFWVGQKLFSPTIWGCFQGESLFWRPLYWISWYFFYLRFFGRNRIYLVAWLFFISSVAITSLFDGYFIRFIPLPFVLLLFNRLLNEANFKNGAAFGLLLSTQVILTLESAFLVPVFVSLLFLFEIKNGPRVSFHKHFHRSLCVISTGLLCWSLWWGFLYAHDALVPFLQFLTSSLSDFRFVYGIPLSFVDPGSKFAAITPILLLWILIFYLLLNWKQKIPLKRTEDWKMLGLGLFLLLYYVKFLNQADGHVFHPFWVSVPLLGYVGFRILEFVDTFFQTIFKQGSLVRSTRYPLCSSLVLLLTLLYFGHTWVTSVGKIHRNFASLVDYEPKQPRILYDAATPDQRNAIEDLQRFFSTYLSPEDTIFDFTNQAALFHFILRRRPSTNFLYVSWATHRSAQRNLTEQLKRVRPKMIIYYVEDHFMHIQGVPGMVRQYDVSAYILEHYKPFIQLDGYLILVRKDLSLRPPPAEGLQFLGPAHWQNLRYQTEDCNWGFVPHFFDPNTTPVETLPLAFTKDKSNSLVFKISQNEIKRYRYIDVEFLTLQEDRFNLVPLKEMNAPLRNQISFSTLPGGRRTYRISVGSCSQWHEYPAGDFILSSKHPNTIRQIRLSR